MIEFDENYYKSVYKHYHDQNPRSKLDFYKATVEAYAPRTSPRSILDVGCAFGYFLRSLPEDWRRHGIDTSDYSVGEAAKAARDIQFAAATLENNPFSGPFDVITSFDVVEHIPDLDFVARAVKSLLAPNGIFVFVVPVYDGPFGPVVQFLDHDPTHIHKNGRAFWLDWAAKHFEVLEWRGIFRYLLFPKCYLHLPTRLGRQVSPAILIVARNRNVE